jgi:chlorite dismutase
MYGARLNGSLPTISATRSTRSGGDCRPASVSWGARSFGPPSTKPRAAWQCGHISPLDFGRTSIFFFWVLSKEPDPIQELAVNIYHTGFGKYLHMTTSYFALMRESPYVKDHLHAPMPEVGDCKYLVVYPFIKSREWYLMSFDARQGMMNEHIKVGHEFPAIRINTAYSFGVDDQDFVVAFDTNSLTDFQDLVMRLRETEASRYTVRDTPMIVGVAKSLDDILTTAGA